MNLETKDLIERYTEALEYNREHDVFGEDAKNNTRGDLESFITELDSIRSSNVVYTIKQYDTYFSTHYADFGSFTNKEIAVKSFINGFEALHPGFIEDFYENGENQWVSDKFEFGVMITETSLGEFGKNKINSCS